MESTPPPENRRALPWHWIVLGLLVVVHAAFGAWFYKSGTSSAVKSILMGLILTQPFLFAFWAAYAPQHFYQRFLWSLLLCLIVSFTGDVGGGRTELGILMIVDVILFMLATPVFLLIRRCYGWQITVTDGEFITSDYQRYQFGIKHLLFLTTVVALGLGLIRTLLLMSISPFLPIAKLIVIIATLFALLIPAIVLSWLMLGNRWVYLVYYLLCVGIVDLGIYQLAQSYKFNKFADIEEQLYFQLGAALSVLFTTLVMRWCGFRMVRVRKSAASVGDA